MPVVHCELFYIFLLSKYGGSTLNVKKLNILTAPKTPLTFSPQFIHRLSIVVTGGSSSALKSWKSGPHVGSSSDCRTSDADIVSIPQSFQTIPWMLYSWWTTILHSIKSSIIIIITMCDVSQASKILTLSLSSQSNLRLDFPRMRTLTFFGFFRRSGHAP